MTGDIAGLPFAPACERNREPILRVMLPFLYSDEEDAACVLEIGSGTGQHAAWFCDYFASRGADPSLRRLQWQCSDVAINLAGIAQWRAQCNKANFLPPIELDLQKRNWPKRHFQFIYTANTLHIVSWRLVLAFVECVQHCLAGGGRLFIYGPFNYGGRYTSHSNARFDAGLRARDPQSGIRDIEAVCAALGVANVEQAAQQTEAGTIGAGALELEQDIAMPANNRFLVFKKSLSKGEKSRRVAVK